MSVRVWLGKYEAGKVNEFKVNKGEELSQYYTHKYSKSFIPKKNCKQHLYFKQSTKQHKYSENKY